MRYFYIFSLPLLKLFYNIETIQLNLYCLKYMQNVQKINELSSDFDPNEKISEAIYYLIN